MIKKYSLKFWIIFWVAATLFLVGWFFFWQVKSRGIQSVGSVVRFLPIASDAKQELKTLASLADHFLQSDGREQTFLILFQNNMELRPGGGYIGSFGIVKIKSGKVTALQIHDLSNFDGRVPDVVPPPYPMAETLHIPSLKLRDSNYSPDFVENAKQAEYFYYLGKGEEQFDGVVAVNANVLTSFLKATGPVQIEGYPGEYGSENAILALEYQVEKGYDDQGIPKGDRKSVMSPLAQAIIAKIYQLDVSGKIELAKILAEDLNRKDIQLYFHDPVLQQSVAAAGWAGTVDQAWRGDYLMVVDANLGAYKSDYYMRRSLNYSVDLSQAKPVAHLKITYTHTAMQRDWMTKDYLTYVRVYVPDGSWLINSQNAGEARYGNELGKKYFAFLVPVKLGETKTIELEYALPDHFSSDKYSLKIQKQPGTADVPVKVQVVAPSGSQQDFDVVLNKDIELPGGNQ
ncbi:DUF4012 domain-containing protein [Patescibacteria group bacterium]|nr:MAG: DUF4012 domain-containing protein [Patescibacteria group bacterium]